MQAELPKHFDPTELQSQVAARWQASGVTTPRPDARESRYTIMMPLPNVTGALHMGHAMDNVMQDLLIRWHRMQGDNSLWMPGTDHAGIATQAVVEKRLIELEGKTRHDLGRTALVERIWAWKHEYEERIISQQKGMGCSCAWDLHRFTMDKVCARAVREAFFRLFVDGLIYQGDRLVNWDCHLQTAVSDDEIERKTTQGHFWHIRYPILNPQPGEPSFITVATTRPETMLGDTAVAVHPNPEGALKEAITAQEKKIQAAARKDREGLEAELEAMKARAESHLPRLQQLSQMARDGRKILLPLLNREIPLIADYWARPELGSGCVKITPAHDPNDYGVWGRHKAHIDIINVLSPDGTYNQNAGQYAGLDRYKVREKVVEDLKALGLLERIEDREIELGLSDRSKTVIEPYLSKQWFVRMGDVPGGIEMGAGTPRAFRSPGLAQAAMDAVRPDWQSPTGRRLEFHPDPERYAGTYTAWLAEKRDWCISRQLWWGHQIPIWHGQLDRSGLEKLQALVGDGQAVFCWVNQEDGSSLKPAEVEGEGPFRVLVGVRRMEDEARVLPPLEALGLTRDPDVLDTWFSSALWPFSTLGWPDPATAAINPGQVPLGNPGGESDYLSYFYPGSCLVTARDIITLWVARMNIMGLYALGDVPFTDCFIHANIQDGKGERMSKSKGNGIDPMDIISSYGADAMRYVLCDMQTGTQDIKIPVQAISPFTGKPVDLTTARHGRTIFTYLDPENGQEFDVLGTLPDLPKATVTSDRFEVGRAFCTKLWNAARFVFMNLGEHGFRPLAADELMWEDRWILSRLSKTIQGVQQALEGYNPSAAIGVAREFFWSELCDWYLELVKPRFRSGDKADVARSVLAVAMDQVLRLFHPFVPFITETLWERLNAQAPVRGIEAPLEIPELLLVAPWPVRQPAWELPEVEGEFDVLKGLVRALRDLRSTYQVPPSRPLEALLKVGGARAELFTRLGYLVSDQANLSRLEVGPEVARPALSAFQVYEDTEIYLLGAVDPEKEKQKLKKQLEKLSADLDKAEKKLTNPQFVEKAPPAVVESERKRVEELRLQVTRLEQSLAELG